MDGSDVRLSYLFEGRRTLLIVLSSDCGLCGLLTSRFNEEYPRMGSDYRLVAIAVDPVSRLVQYQKERNLLSPLYSDALGTFVGRYGIGSYPAVIGIDGSRKIVFVDFGYRADRGLKDCLKKL